MPLEKKNCGCYNKGKKKHFQSPFHFLISLFSWTPRDRLVNDPGALHCGDAPTGNTCTAGLYSLHHWVPLGIVSLYDAPTGNTCTAGLLSIDLWVPLDIVTLWGCPHGLFVHGWSVFVTPLGIARYRYIVGMPPQAFRARLVCYR